MRAIPFPPTLLPSDRARPGRFSLRGQGQHLSPALDHAHLAGEVVAVGVDPELRVSREKLDISLREIRMRGCFSVLVMRLVSLSGGTPSAASIEEGCYLASWVGIYYSLL